MNFNKIGQILAENQEFIWAGIASTLILSIFGTVVGLFLGILLAYGKLIKVKELDNGFVKVLKNIIKGFCIVYSTVFRGTPMMVQALIFKYGFQAIGVNFENIFFGSMVSNVLNGWLICGLIVITLNTAAYMGEVVISGLNGVDLGQVEGARSLGLSSRQTSMSVILPQALRNALPTIGNEFIVNIKDSSVLNVIAVTELYYRLKDIAATNYAFLESYLILAVIYLIMTLLAALAFKLVEKKLDGKKISLNPFGRLLRRNEI